MFHKILVGVDESTNARRAVNAAVDLAKHYNAALCLVHAFPEVPDYLGSPTYDHLIENATMKGRELLDDIYNELEGKVKLETQLIQGTPASALLRVADTEGFDLIVVGSRGHNQIVNLLMGSVSTAVTQKAHCPVMVIH